MQITSFPQSQLSHGITSIVLIQMCSCDTLKKPVTTPECILSFLGVGCSVLALKSKPCTIPYFCLKSRVATFVTLSPLSWNSFLWQTQSPVFTWMRVSVGGAPQATWRNADCLSSRYPRWKWRYSITGSWKSFLIILPYSVSFTYTIKFYLQSREHDWRMWILEGEGHWERA